MRRCIPLLALLSFALAGCLDQGPAEPIPIDQPSFYNSSGNYWEVTKLEDTNDGICDTDCSLREAIVAAAPGDEIRFGVTGTITLTATLQAAGAGDPCGNLTLDQAGVKGQSGTGDCW